MRLALAFLLAFASVNLYAQDTTCGIIWDEPILLSDTSYNAGSPHIALSGDDTVHIVWYAGGTRLPYRRSTNGGAGFEPTKELLTDSITFPFDANRPSVVAWEQIVYVFFQGGLSDIYSPVRMIKSTTGGATWQYPVDISPDTTSPPPLTPTILGDTIAMTYVPSGQVTDYILRSTNAGLSWVSKDVGLPSFSRFSLGSGVGSSPNVLHVVGIGVVGNQGEIEYRRSHDLGDTWVQQTFLSSIDGLQSIDPIIAASVTLGDTTVIAAWRDPKYGCIGVFGCSIIGRAGQVGDSLTTWNGEEVHTFESRGFEPSLAIGGGRKAIAWRYEVDPGTTFHALVRVTGIVDTMWCPPYDLTPTTTHKVINVEVALSTSEVHVVWEQNVAPDPSTFRIFYCRGRFITTGVDEQPPTLPQTTLLAQNYPNPFNPSTKIVYRVGSQESVSLRVYDVLGRAVGTLINEKRDAGEHSIEWDAANLPSGVYYYRLMAGGKIETRKAILMK